MPEPVEALLDGRVTLAASAKGLKPTTDTVLLAAAVADGAGVLDAGCGSGGAMLCLAARSPRARITGLERDSGLVEQARRNVAMNGLADRIAVVEGDLASWRGDGHSFDVVMTNPPHLDPRTSRPSGDPLRAAAMVETMALGDWLRSCLRLLRCGGTLVLVHRPERLEEILSALAGFAGAVDVKPLFPRAGGSPARRILVSATRGSRRPLRLLPGLVLHEADGAWTPAARRILRDAGSLNGEGPG